MSMTESNNHIEIVDSLRSLYPLQDFEEKAVMEVVEELNAYRASGTVEECEKATDFELAKKDKSLAKVIDEYLEYIKTGTIEEFKALKNCGTHDCIVKHLTNECSYSETGCSDCRGKEKIRIALEKAEPKPIIINRQEDNVFYHCSQCKTLIGKSALSIASPYCRNCGQRFGTVEVE